MMCGWWFAGRKCRVSRVFLISEQERLDWRPKSFDASISAAIHDDSVENVEEMPAPSVTPKLENQQPS